ncbi:MAG: heme-binding protein [Acidimicrobiales bacterium]|jgi:hypothetical protein
MPTFRASPSNAVVLDSLGLLAELPGHWEGHGFNSIARPDKHVDKPFLLELNSTTETLDFTAINGNMPNRGSAEPDIDRHGVHYLQQVGDRATDTGIHIEPGSWLHVPPADDPTVSDRTPVHQATIPPGDSVVAKSTAAATLPAGPTTDPVGPAPYSGYVPALSTSPTTPVVDVEHLAPFMAEPLSPFLPDGLVPATTINSPALVLAEEIRGEAFVDMVVLVISTTQVGGDVNIPFVTQTGEAVQLDAIFWIETVRHPVVGDLLQLQYVQRIVLDFAGIQWPHISVATLHKQ